MCNSKLDSCAFLAPACEADVMPFLDFALPRSVSSILLSGEGRNNIVPLLAWSELYKGTVAVMNPNLTMVWNAFALWKGDYLDYLGFVPN